MVMMYLYDSVVQIMNAMLPSICSKRMVILPMSEQFPTTHYRQHWAM